MTRRVSRGACRFAGFLALGLGAAACRTTPPGAPPPGPEPAADGLRPEEIHLAVVRTDPVLGIVFLECVPPLPEDTRVELFRNGRRVAIVRLTAHRRHGMVAAEILSGTPHAGDSGIPVPAEQEPVEP